MTGLSFPLENGSHTAAMPLRDVLEGVALLERALNLVYDHTVAELDQLARKINAARRSGRTTSPSVTPDCDP